MIATNRPLRDTAHGFRSSVAERAAATTYDRQAAMYDRVIGSAPYNRIVWGTATADYTRFARRAVADADGPMLDAGCGTLVFSAAAYREASRPLVLTDRSEGMLARAARRVAEPHEVLLHADLFDLPFEPGSFATVASFGVLHCLDDLDRAVASLCSQAAPGARLFASSLVGETGRGRRMLKLLHRAGETAPPRTQGEFLATVERHFDGVEAERRGSMVYVTARAG